MKPIIFTTSIDLIHSRFWELGTAEAVTFSWIWAKSIDQNTEREGNFFEADRELAAFDFSLKSDTIYRHHKILEEKELIKIAKFKKKDYISLTPKSKDYLNLNAMKEIALKY